MMMMMMRKNLLAVVWLLLSSSLTHVNGEQAATANAIDDIDGEGYMYGTQTAAIQEYSETTGLFQKSTHPRVVEFYSPTCGACLGFKAEYTELAKQMAIQYPQVEFYAVSCLEHRGMCKDYSIQGYPALLTFGAGSKEGKPIKYGAKKTVDFLAKTLGLDDDDTNTHISRRLQDGDGDEEDKDGDTKSDDEDKDSDEEDKDSDEEDEDKDSGDEDKDSDEEDKDSGDEDKDGANKSDADKDGNEDKDEDKDSDEDKDEDKDSDEDKDGANKSDADKDGDEDKDSDEKNSEFGKADKDGKDSEDSDDKDGDEPDDSEEEEENEDDDGKDEDESESESEDVPPPRAANRPVVAGAAKGRLERKDMDRWKTQMAGLKKEHEDRRKRLGGIISPPIPKHTRGAVEKTTSETMTDKMKAFSPGTPEYEKRKNDLLERVAAGRAKMEARGKPGSTITKDTVLKKESLPFSKDVRKQSFVQKQVGKVPIVKRLVRMTPEEALINDASRSFVHSLRYGVFMSDEPLTLPRKMALQNWLEFLSVSLPPEWGLHRIIDDVRRQINFVAQADKNLHAVLDAHTSTMPRGTWSFSCTGLGNKATTKSQGFSCGFWKLLHTATVGVAEHKGGLNLVKSGMISDTQKTFSPIEAADTIKDYIAMFFNCEECKRHFVEHYNNCANNRRCDRLTDDVETATTGDWKELALWMWEVHNEVSVRIVSEKRKKQLQRGLNAVGSLDEVMVVWPTIGDCFRCFEDDGTWDEPEVFARLEYAYWPDSELDPKNDRLLKFEGESTSSLGFLWIFMFLVLYAVYSAIASPSGAIHRSVLAARRLVAESTKATSGGASAKKRSL